MQLSLLLMKLNSIPSSLKEICFTKSLLDSANSFIF